MRRTEAVIAAAGTAAGGGDTFLGASTALNGDSIGAWTSNDVIDLTGMNVTPLSQLGFKGTTLTVKDSSHTTAISFSGGGVRISNFTVLGSDGHGGSLIGHN